MLEYLQPGTYLDHHLATSCLLVTVAANRSFFFNDSLLTVLLTEHVPFRWVLPTVVLPVNTWWAVGIFYRHGRFEQTALDCIIM